MAGAKQKLYAYVDETGQDAASLVFVVVAVVSDAGQDALRETLISIEVLAKTGARKWHKSHPDRSRRYLELTLERLAVNTKVFFGTYPKPIPYFFPDA